MYDSAIGSNNSNKAGKNGNQSRDQTAPQSKLREHPHKQLLLFRTEFHQLQKLEPDLLTYFRSSYFH
jgi:hypothetical protein